MEIDRDLQRKRIDSTPKRIFIEDILSRDIIELGKYRDLMEIKIPKIVIVKRRKLVTK